MMSCIENKIRLATFNVASVRKRLPILERWLPASGVDVLLLQETKVQDEDFPKEFFASLGYDANFCGEKKYNGVAAITKTGIKATVTFGFNDGQEPNFETRVCLVRLKPGEGESEETDLTVLNTYVPQGKSIDHEDFNVKKKFLVRVRQVVEQEMSGAFVWTGDLNVAPTDIDLARPKENRNHVCFCEEIRSCFAATSNGLTDMLRVFHPEAGEFTFFDYRVKNALARNIGWRIDHFLASPSLAARAEDCFIDREPRGWDTPSDHTPLVLDLKLKNTA